MMDYDEAQSTMITHESDQADFKELIFQIWRKSSGCNGAQKNVLSI